MSNLVSAIQDIYSAFGRGDINYILGSLTEDVIWEFEAPAVLSFSGIRHGVPATAGFFEGINKDHADPKLEMTEFVASGDIVAAFGRYEATMKSSGKRVNTPVAHYFRFRDGKIAQYKNFINSAAFVEAM